MKHLDLYSNLPASGDVGCNDASRKLGVSVGAISHQHEDCEKFNIECEVSKAIEATNSSTTSTRDHAPRYRLVTVKQMAAMPAYAWLSESAIRHLIHDAKPRFNSKGEEIGGNGLVRAIIKISRKVLIDLDAFDSWVMSKRESGQGAGV